MITYTTINYSDIYSDPKPTLEDLLNGINSKVIIILMSMINSELYPDRDTLATQRRLTEYITNRFPYEEKRILYNSLNKFHQKAKGPIAIWSKRYALEFMKQVFLVYKDTGEENTTPEEEVRIFKAYLVICEDLNEKDRIEFKKLDGISKEDLFF